MSIYAFYLGLIVALIGIVCCIGWNFLSAERKLWTPLTIIVLGIAIMALSNQHADAGMSNLINLR